MKKKNWVKAMLIMTLVCSMPLQAEEAELSLKETLNLVYTDTSEMNLPFYQIPGFFVCPLQSEGEVLSEFGDVRTGYAHEGIDIRTEEGTPVFAIADGVVTKAAPDSKGVDYGGGHIIIVDFGNGIEGRYMHLSGYGVRAGEEVKAGQVIGFTGNSGDSTTPHLHFEYRENGELIDPSFIFEASGMIEGYEEESTSASGVISGYNSSLISTYNEPFFVVQK